MYLIFGIFLVICFLFVCLQCYRKKRMICKVRQMDVCRKACLLNELLTPFGFCYQQQQDIIMTTLEAWQRPFGYRSLFDSTALRFGMVFDCEPIFFYYNGRTYRIEVWKGQYGVNLGGEVGIYYADGILTPEQFDTAHFQSVPDEEMLPMEISLYHKSQEIFESTQMHWWLAGFCTGKYGEPENLAMRVSITFINQKMLSCFVKSLLHMGYRSCEISICNLTVSFFFSRPYTKQPRLAHRLRAFCSQWKNKQLCKLFLYMTRPFSSTLDRIMYLYFFLPSAFRRMFLCRRNRVQKFHKKKKAVHKR